MPPLDDTCSALDCEAASEGSEASTTHTCAVVGEDVVLVLWSELVHAWWRAGEETRVESEQRQHCKAEKGAKFTDSSTAKEERSNMQQHKHV